MNNDNQNVEGVESLTEAEQFLQSYEKMVKDLNLEVKSIFVPFSISRDAKKEYKTVNWKVTLSSGKKNMTIDYSQGVGLLPYPQTTYLNRADQRLINEAIGSAVETGLVRKATVEKSGVRFSPSTTRLKGPDLQDILYSLCSESDVANYLTYESWANDSGYDADSRSGEKIYNDCRKNAEQFITIMGGKDNVDKMNDIVRGMDECSVVVKTKVKP